jgi:hypothetical protein
MDFEDIFNNILVGVLVLFFMFLLTGILMFISLYADWLEPIAFGFVLFLAYGIGKYVRGNKSV